MTGNNRDFCQPANLSPEHYKEWQDSAVCDPIIQRNVWTITDPREVDQLLNRNTDKRWKHSVDLSPGWAVAGVAPHSGERTFAGAQYKPDNPPKDPDSGKPRKYYSPSRQALSPLFLEMEAQDYWQKLITNTSEPIAICEGAKKAGALLSKGIPAISIPGVSTGGKLGRLRPELELFCSYGRTFYLYFDRDIVEKRQVRRALHNLGRMLAGKGAMVYVVEWPNMHKGIDDAIAAGVDVQKCIQQAPTLEEWKAEADANDTEPPEGEPCALARRYEMVAQRLRGRLRWNELKGQIELDGEVCELDALRIHLALSYNIQLPDSDCTAICTHIAKQQQFSPVAEYLNQCAKLYPADSDLLDSLASSMLGTSDPLHQSYIRKTLISAVARAFWPGCKVDTVCILAGAQGVGKSSFWKILASEDWFDDTVGSASDKDERLKLHQSWFIEWAELEAVFKRKDISTVKAFITTQADQVRPPYGRAVMEFRRPSIIVGSTNETEFLADATGNRRYWVVPVLQNVPLQQLAIDRDRIWAAAVHAFRQGERWELPVEMRDLAAIDAANYVTTDPWEDTIMDFCEDKATTTTPEILTLALKLDLDKMDKRAEMRVAHLLKVNGWRSSREVVHGRRRRIWKNPKFDDLGCPGCPENSETQTGVRGQPNGQPTGQPTGQPPENADQDTPSPLDISKRDNLDNVDNQLPKSSRTQDVSQCADRDLSIPPVRSKVRIRAGRYDGLVAWVVAHLDGKVSVKREGWVITREYEPGEVEVLSHG